MLNNWFLPTNSCGGTNPFLWNCSDNNGVEEHPAEALLPEIREGELLLLAKRLHYQVYRSYMKPDHRNESKLGILS